MISSTMSMDIVNYLLKEGYTVNRIAEMINVPVDFIKEILKEEKNLNNQQLLLLNEKTHIPLTKILVEAIPEDHIPDNWKEKFEKMRVKYKIICSLQEVIKKKKL